MTLVLDSTIVVDLERGNKKTISSIEKLKEKFPGLPIITFITYFEFFEGLLRRDVKSKEGSLEFLNKFSYLHITKKTAEILAELKTNNSKKGINLPLADLLIAAQVKENNLLLITKDNHFKQIEEIDKIILD
jgi:tRNA(fMet)-specific endonuclease VapC